VTTAAQLRNSSETFPTAHTSAADEVQLQSAWIQQIGLDIGVPTNDAQ